VSGHIYINLEFKKKSSSSPPVKDDTFGFAAATHGRLNSASRRSNSTSSNQIDGFFSKGDSFSESPFELSIFSIDLLLDLKN
jgi:hypothetical protein